MIFEKRSTRTRMSTETGVHPVNGAPLPHTNKRCISVGSIKIRHRWCWWEPSNNVCSGCWLAWWCWSLLLFRGTKELLKDTFQSEPLTKHSTSTSTSCALRILNNASDCFIYFNSILSLNWLSLKPELALMLMFLLQVLLYWADTPAF